MPRYALDMLILALRTMMTEVAKAGEKATSSSEKVVQALVPQLTEQVESTTDGLQTSALDSMNDLVYHLGKVIAGQPAWEQSVAETWLTHMADRRAAVVRRAIQGLGTCGYFANDRHIVPCVQYLDYVRDGNARSGRVPSALYDGGGVRTTAWHVGSRSASAFGTEWIPVCL